MKRCPAQYWKKKKHNHLTIYPGTPHRTSLDAGMPNLRTNPFSTDSYHLFHSMDKNRFCLTRFGYYTPSPLRLALSRLAVFRVRRVNFCRLLPPPPRLYCTFETRGISREPSELFSATTPRSRSPLRSGRLPKSHDFFGIPIGQPWQGHCTCSGKGNNNW